MRKETIETSTRSVVIKFEYDSYFANMSYHLRGFSALRSSSRPLSEAGLIVTAAAERVETVDPTDILTKMDQEKINEAWQLEFVDALQWQMLGAPVGLVAAIRRCLAELKVPMRESTSDYPSIHDSYVRPTDYVSSPRMSNIVPPENFEAAAIISLPRARGIPVHIVSRSRSSVPPKMPQRRTSAGNEWQRDECDEEDPPKTPEADLR